MKNCIKRVKQNGQQQQRNKKKKECNKPFITVMIVAFSQLEVLIINLISF